MIKLLRYQEEAVNKLHNGAILHGETGSGKSLTGLAYYKKCWSHLDLYIITTSKKRDSLEWEDEIQKIECNPPKAIDSWNNLKKYRGVKDAFFLFDEHKVGGHGKWAQAMIALSKNNKWILLTATPGDRWDDYATIFIANGFVQNKTAWNNDFCIWDRISKYPKIKGYQHEDILEKMRDAVLVHMEYKSEKVPIPRVISYKVDHEEEQYILARRKSLRHPEMRPFKNISAMFAYMRMNQRLSRLLAYSKRRRELLCSIISSRRSMRLRKRPSQRRGHISSVMVRLRIRFRQEKNGSMQYSMRLEQRRGTVQPVIQSYSTV